MITFYYTIPTLINSVNLEVLYKVRNRTNVVGIGENSIVDAETLITEYLGNISSEIFNKLTSPMGRAVAELDTPLEPYEFDVTYTHPDTLTDYENSIVFRIIEKDKFDVTTAKAIERAIQNTMVSYCVYQWLMDSNIQGWEKYEAEHIRYFDNLRGMLTRRVNLTRTYKLY